MESTGTGRQLRKRSEKISYVEEVPKSKARVEVAKKAERRSKSKEPPLKSNESPSKLRERRSKSKEPPSKSNETPSKLRERRSKSKELPLKSNESPSKSKEPLSKPNGRRSKSKEPPSKSKELPPKSNKSPSKSNELSSKSKEPAKRSLSAEKTEGSTKQATKPSAAAASLPKKPSNSNKSKKVAEKRSAPLIDLSSDDEDYDFVPVSPPKKRRASRETKLETNSETNSKTKSKTKSSKEKPQNDATDSKKKSTMAKAKKVKKESAVVGSSGSEDEWEDVEALPAAPLASSSSAAPKKDIEITVERPLTDNEKKWQTYLRRELNRARKEQQDQSHKTHLLCYIAHLRHWSATASNELVKAVALSLVPDGFVTAAQHTFTVAIAERFIKWFKSAFVVRNSEAENSVDSVAFLISCLESKTVDSTRSLTLVLLAILRSLSLDSRLCMSCQPIGHKLEKDDDGDADTEETGEPKPGPSKKRSSTGKKTAEENDSPTKKKKKGAAKPVRDSWVEYWSEEDEQWIAIDPLHASVDQPKDIEADVTKPIHYVLAVDNDGGIRDLTSRYAAHYLSVAIRRLRAEPDWWSETVRKFRSPRNRQRERLEDMMIHSLLMSQPLPTVVSEFKNHPLYVLKRDLLKFQGIYPPDIEPIGHIRNDAVYPRSSVHILHCKESWMIKKGRVIKEGEEPYKTVKARPKLNAPKEEQQERQLSLFGFWQTEPYVPAPAKDGKVPRNPFGNVEVYRPSMIPPGTVHLRIPGLLVVAKKLDIDCAAAVVGWEFHCRGSHPLTDGWIVCTERAPALLAAWKEEKARKDEQNKEKREQRALKNWKRLIKGLLTRQRVQRKFNPTQESSKHKGDELLEDDDENENEDKDEDDTPNDPGTAWPQCKQNFELDSNSKVRSRDD